MYDFCCKELSLEGYRGFQNSTKVKFHPNLNIFFGINGSGKSTILRALKLFLSITSEDTLLPLSDSDINHISEKLKLELIYCCSGIYNSEITFDKLHNQTYFNRPSKNIRSTSLIVSYSVNRLITDEYSKNIVVKIKKPNAFNSLLEPTINFSDFYSGFIWLSLKQTQMF